jgi:FtsP/CotA-like multicopper oxidase with cupredoxin domain
MEDGDLCTTQTLELEPFAQPLPIQPNADDVALVEELVPPVDPGNNATDPKVNERVSDLLAEVGIDDPNPTQIQRFDEFPPVKFYEMTVAPMEHLFHPDLMTTSTLWGYNGFSPGPTFRSNYGEPIVVRIHNNLPPGPEWESPAMDEFGIPQITTHLHNFHTAPESDGGPVWFYDAGHYTDHHYAMAYAGGDPREALGHLWYHDHRADFTAQNTYKGLVGQHLIYDALDANDEENKKTFRLPSGEFDVPLTFADKKFDFFTHELVFDKFNFDGFLGDQMTVNGAVTPYFEVERRKYRFRMLNVGPSRIYDFRFVREERDGTLHENSKVLNFEIVGNDGNLLQKRVKGDVVSISPAERLEVVVDFKKGLPPGSRVQLVNVADQTSGKGRSGVVLPVDQADKIMQFRVASGPPARDGSRTPKRMRSKPTIPESEVVCERVFEFDNQNSDWTVNDRRFEFVPRFNVAQGTAERWILRNAARDWEHPIHIHLEEHQIETRDGAPPPEFERMRKDVTLLRPGDEIVLTMRHRTWRNMYPIHCHNTVHEDHAMMLLWNVVEDPDDADCNPRP